MIKITSLFLEFSFPLMFFSFCSYYFGEAFFRSAICYLIETIELRSASMPAYKKKTHFFFFFIRANYKKLLRLVSDYNLILLHLSRLRFDRNLNCFFYSFFFLNALEKKYDTLMWDFVRVQVTYVRTAYSIM